MLDYKTENITQEIWCILLRYDTVTSIKRQ